MHLDIDGPVETHQTTSPIRTVMCLRLATLKRHLPPGVLPDEVLATPLHNDCEPVYLMLVQDRRGDRVWYYIRVVAGSRRWQLISLGYGIPLDTLDAYRRLIADENERRDRYRSQEGDTIR